MPVKYTLGYIVLIAAANWGFTVVPLVPVFGEMFPAMSVDSADIARNNNRKQNTIESMIQRWDCSQPQFRWSKRPVQIDLMVNDAVRDLRA